MQNTTGFGATARRRRFRSARCGASAAGGWGVVLAVSLGLAGCSGLDQSPEIHDVTRPPVTSASGSATPSAAAQTGSRDGDRDADDPAQQIRPAPPRVETSNAAIMTVLDEIAPLLADGTVVALAPIGRADEVGRVGAKRSGGPYPAGMTIAIPLAAAVLRERPEYSETAAQALGGFDADAGRQLVDVLGADAGTVLGEVLAENGDEATRVAGEDLAEGEPIPGGGIRWAVADQARFLSGLPCRDYGDGVVWDMGTVGPELRWGLGAVRDSHIMSTELPAVDGGSAVVRQAAIVHVEGGDLAVAIAAEADSVGDGRIKVADAATHLEQRLGRLYGGRCTP